MRHATPNPALWLWYLWGGRLPMRYREWVLHDLTAPTWLARHILRAVLRTLIVVAVLLAVLVAVWHVSTGLAIAAAGLGCLIGGYYSLPFVSASADAELTRYGYPEGYATQRREELATERQRAYYQRRGRHI